MRIEDASGATAVRGNRSRAPAFSGDDFASWTENLVRSLFPNSLTVRCARSDLRFSGSSAGYTWAWLAPAGTGSAVIQQLVRLGIGTISVFDGDRFAGSNVNRVYGSTVFDAGRAKVVLQSQQVHGIGLGTDVRAIPRHITEESAARELRSCDVVFGCTDKALPRGILVRLALHYLVPVIDMGVTIESEEGTICGIYGRVTTLMLGEACLFCRGRTSPDRIREESLPVEQREREVAEGYAKELATNEPAVIMFTTMVAAQAVSELLHRLTGFMGADRESSEVLLFLHESRIRTNRTPPNPDCQCLRARSLGEGGHQELSRTHLGTASYSVMFRPTR